MTSEGVQMNEAPIGVFDSGLGGLTVVREIIRRLPNEKIVYFGDTARVPYGSKSKETVLRYSEQIIHFLRTKNVKAIVTACNTASALALPELEKTVDIPIVGVIRPGALAAVRSTKNRRIGVIGTEGLVRSGLYGNYIAEEDPGLFVTSKACPLFVPLVEEGLWDGKITGLTARMYLKQLKREKIDTLILGCTHYPLLISTVSRVMGKRVKLVNPAEETAAYLKQVLVRENLCRSISGAPDDAGGRNEEPENLYRFYVSDDPGKFSGFAASVLGVQNLKAEKINIETY